MKDQNHLRKRKMILQRINIGKEILFAINTMKQIITLYLTQMTIDIAFIKKHMIPADVQTSQQRQEKHRLYDNYKRSNDIRFFTKRIYYIYHPYYIQNQQEKASIILFNKFRDKDKFDTTNEISERRLITDNQKHPFNIGYKNKNRII